MIYRVRSMTLLPHQAAVVRAVALRAAAYATEHFAGIEVEILENVAGSQRQLHMVTRCASLAALEEYEGTRVKDEQWMALVKEVNALEGIGEIVDSLYRSVAA